MTRDEILKMEAGRETDALVAEKVMGWRRDKLFIWHEDMLIPSEAKGRELVKVAFYSTDIAAAWEVVEKAREMEGYFQLEWTDRLGAYYCEIAFDGYTWYAEADTAPLAICRAALLAVLE